ncbi:hypothetical protein B7P43_G15219 [Cryptotermes secundus]|uniref:Uncharacterized protein n=1 Tax=Cryptotermes secundus TaxID=105785 RepID=A0A2J7QD08_9NEOP|nr:hypothetical protein B7P43_G15219 [Cryptotermes secundus]
MNGCVVHANTEDVSLLGYLSNSEFPLPLYNDAAETNPVFHLRRFDEFINFHNVPKPLRLAVACRSMVGHIGKQWVEAVMHNVADYEAFKKAFLNTWWSTSRQSLVKCTLYQAKYDRRSGLSLSGHFLKHVTMASYLDPRPSDGELIEAIRAHYPIGVQRAMLTNQMYTIDLNHYFYSIDEYLQFKAIASQWHTKEFIYSLINYVYCHHILKLLVIELFIFLSSFYFIFYFLAYLSFIYVPLDVFHILPFLLWIYGM